MKKIERNILAMSDASYAKCDVAFETIDSKVDWASYQTKAKKSRKPLLWTSVAFAGVLLVVLAIALPKLLMPAGVSNPGRLVAGEYSLDLNRSSGKMGDLAFADGQKMSVATNGTSSGLGVVNFDGADGTFKGTVTFVDGPLAEYRLTKVTSERLSTYEFVLSKNEKELTISLGCDKSWGEVSYDLYIRDASRSISCTIDYH
jgi:hypothetical protein